jgi:L-amino acid N-acyltransferase YncA
MGTDLALRTAVPADLPAIAAIYSHAIANTTATFDTREKTAADMEEWMFEHSQRSPRPWPWARCPAAWWERGSGTGWPRDG